MPLFNTLTSSFNRAPTRREDAGDDFGPSVKPAYEIKENDDAYGVTVHLPGVTKETLEITADNSQLVIRGRRVWKQPEGWTVLYRESVDAGYELVLAHDNAIDADKIAAELRDGVLRVSLPKAEAVKPRKIAVN